MLSKATEGTPPYQTRHKADCMETGQAPDTGDNAALLEDGTGEIKGLCSPLPVGGGLRKICQAPLLRTHSSDLVPQPPEPQGEPLTSICMCIFRV